MKKYILIFAASNKTNKLNRVRHTITTVKIMRTSKINIGAKVFNKKNQEGTITSIITKSTGYVEVTYLNGVVKKEMAFNLTDENGESLKAAPKAKAKKPVTLTKEEKIQIWKKDILLVNNRTMYNVTIVELCVNELTNKRSDNEFYNCLIDTFFKAYFGKAKVSEKQAYHLAKFIVENDK